MTNDTLNTETFGEEVLSVWETTYHGWVNEAMTHIQRGELLEAIPYLNLCLNKANNNSLETTNSILQTTADELNLLEKRCLIHMKLKMYDKISEDARRILSQQETHAVAFKCLVAGLCKLNKLKHVREVFKSWKKFAPKDLQMIEARTKVINLIKAVERGIEPSCAFSKIEEMLGLNYDWLLGKKVTDSVWKYRPCPLGSEQLVLCLQYRFGHCSLGEKCTDAHSEEELNEWEQRRTLWNSAKKGSSLNCTDSWTKYMNSISPEIDNLRNDKAGTSNLEAECGISIVSETPLRLQITSLLKPHLYEFHIKSKKYRLTHICLFDDLPRHYFRISGAEYHALDMKIDLLQREIEDFNITYDQLLEIPSNLKPSEECDLSYNIEVSFETTVFGTFKQLLVFDFDEIVGEQDDNNLPRSIKIIRELSADVVLSDDLESGRLASDVFKTYSDKDDKTKDDTSDETEARFRNRPKILGQSTTWNFGNSEIVDSFNGNKVCSTKVGFALISGRPNSSPEPSNDQDILTKRNYKEKMRHFLTQEERARQEILSKYNILAKMSLSDIYEMKSAGKEGMRYAPEGTLFARLGLFRDVSEDTAVGRLILRNCNYVLISKDESIRAAEKNELKPKVYLCKVIEKTKNVMYFELRNAICDDLGLKNADVALFQVQFQLDRTSFIQQKQVIDLMKPTHLDMLFPEFTNDFKIPWNPVKQWNSIVENDQFRLNPKQKEALIAVTSEDITPPILIIGPFGTGKTFTLAQCIKTSLLEKKSRILICTHSNSAADLYVKEYLDPLTNEFEEAKPLRIYFELRNLATVHHIVQKYCKIEMGRFVMPSKEEILAHRVIVVTLSTSFDLINLNLEEDTFSHILLDEAAQAMESEAITPLLAAGRNTKLVLAGDYMQLSPELFSTSKHFQVSLLERLHCVYTETNPCKILLSENYRSHEAIIQFASNAFYKKKLKCGKRQPAHGTYYPMTFFCARGEDIQEKDSNSYYNMAEVYEVCEKVSELVSSWPESWGNWRDEGAIGILTVYPDQVTRIRSKLRSKGLSNISVERVLNVQGKQFRAVLISTVRTSKPWVHILPGNVGQEVDLGFLSNAKLLNTALTRAQSLVAVVGDPVSLCSHGKCRMLWKDFIEVCHENKSLYGISYSHIKQSILGTELRFIWGVNPLANDFEPSALGTGKQEHTESSVNENEDVDVNDTSNELEIPEYPEDTNIKNNEFSLSNNDQTNEVQNTTAPSANEADPAEFNLSQSPEPTILMDHAKVPKSPPKGSQLPRRDSASGLNHLTPQSEFWHGVRNNLIQNQALRHPQLSHFPYGCGPGLQTYYPIGCQPVLFAPPWFPPPFITPHLGGRYQVPPPTPNPQNIHPQAGNHYLSQPYIPPRGYPPPPLNIGPGPGLSSMQLSGVPLQQSHPQASQVPSNFSRGPSIQQPIHASPWNSDGGQSKMNMSQGIPTAPGQTFTPDEIATMKRALEFYAAGSGQTNVSHQVAPEVENLHQKLSMAEHVTSPTNSMPRSYMNPPNRMSLPSYAHGNMPYTNPAGLHFFPGMPSPQGPAPLFPYNDPVPRNKNIIPNWQQQQKFGVPGNHKMASSPKSPNATSQHKASNSEHASSRSYANVLKKPKGSQKDKVEGSSTSCTPRTSAPGPSKNIAANSSSASNTNVASLANNSTHFPEIVPLMSVPIPETVKKEVQANGAAGNWKAANSKKNRKKK